VNYAKDKLTEIGLKWPKEKKRRSEVRERKSLDRDIEEDRSARKMDCGQLKKWKNPPMDSFENLVGKKERQVDESLKMWVNLT
jgi:hypothetical protein